MRPITRPRLADLCLSMPGCVGLYLLDEGSGTTARDLTNTDSGTYTGTPTRLQPSVTPGDPAVPSMKFPTSSDYVLVKSGAKLCTLVNASLVVGARAIQGFTGNKAIYCERASSGNDIWKWEAKVTDAKIQFVHRNDAGTLDIKTGVGSFSDGKPHVTGFTKSGNALRFFFDGAFDNSHAIAGDDTFTNSGLEARIGGDKGDSTVAWPHWIGFVGLYNRTLTDSQMRAIAVVALGS